MRIIFTLLLLYFYKLSFSQVKESYLLVGTFTKTRGSGQGIYVYKFNNLTGASTFVTKIETENPGYLTVSNNKHFIYAVNQNGNNKVNGVSSFAFNVTTGEINFINMQPINAIGPCYVTVNKKNTWLLTANYGSGSIAVLPIDSNGNILPVKQLVQHTNNNKQVMPHAHTVIFDADEKHLIATDLGLDKVFIYVFDQANKNAPLSIDQSKQITSTLGNGPRHVAFTKKHLYVINELAGTIDVFKYKKGDIKIQQTISIDTNVSPQKSSADIHITSNNKFLYATNRGTHNTITTFKINQNGSLKFLAINSTMGKTPRNFVINETDDFVLVANQDSGNIVVFKRDTKTGLLTNTNQDISVPSAVCLKFIDID